MTDADKRQCRHCTYIFKANDGLRFCRRYPPQVIRSYMDDWGGFQMNSEFPMVTGVEHCGEFENNRSESENADEES